MFRRSRDFASGVFTGRTGRVGFILGGLILTLYAGAISPVIAHNPIGAGPLAVPLICAVFLLVVRRGHDLGIAAIGSLSTFVVAIWVAEVIAINLPYLSSVRLLPLLTLLLLPGQSGANDYGSSRTVQ